MAELSTETLSIQFPVNGIDTAGEFGVQRPETSPDAINVRSYDPFDDRTRGGNRPGIAKYPNQQVPAGTQLIQHLTQLVVISGDFLLYTFDDYEPDFIPNTSTSNDPANPRYPPGSSPTMPPNGSGVQPNRDYPNSDRRRVQAVPDPATQVNGSNSTITATVTRQTADTNVSGVTVTLRTNPPGQDGDGDTAVTNGSGVATFTVNEASFEGTILYTCENEYTSP